MNMKMGIGLSAAALVLLACNTMDRAPYGPNFNTSGTGGNAPGTGHLDLCKLGPAGTTATFSLTHTGAGTLPLGSSVTVPATSVCTWDVNTVWLPNGSGIAPDTITITETGHTAGVVLQRIVTSGIGGINGYQEIAPPQNWITIVMDDTYGVVAIFKNDTLLAPTGEGCTPGYWKQSQHFDSWPSPYTPGQAFSSVFANAFPGKSLVQVLALQGGGLEALGRHAVSALLSAATFGDYGLTTAQVISMFNAAYASGDYETTKNKFAALNEQLCPLN